MVLDDLSNPEIADLIDKYVRGERARAILKRRLIDEICYEPLAEEFDISVPQLKRIIYKAQEQLFKKIK
jgi:DNA-directed RNA polymerase specialized sigma24 family protein